MARSPALAVAAFAFRLLPIVRMKFISCFLLRFQVREFSERYGSRGYRVSRMKIGSGREFNPTSTPERRGGTKN
jgi:hypothetical protein